MCGVNLVLSKHPIPESALPAMQAITGYRGPDNSDEYYYHSNNWHLALGVNRLMVVDRDEASNQPMVSNCGNYVLAYNGEVYNHQDLKNILIKRGVSFKTHSDTEVVLYWLKEYGAQGVCKLKGMFAFVFTNLLNKSVLISRDRHGIKPLYCHKTDDTFIISSTIRGIQNSNLIKLTVNNSAVTEYLSFRHVLGRKTFFNEIVALEPGTTIEINNQLCWKDIELGVVKESYLTDLGESLIDAVTLQNNSCDVPGLMLSGGVDSTLLLAILNKELSIIGTPTYTLNTGADTRWAAKAAKHYQSEHHEIDLDLSNPDSISEFLSLTDQPVADHGAFANWLLAKEVKNQRNVLLSGAGADELFGGYKRHWAFYQYLRNPKKIRSLSNGLKALGIVDLLPTGYRNVLGAVSSDYNKTFENFLKVYSTITSNHKIELGKDDKTPDSKFMSGLRFDQTNYLVNDVLAITDNASMQHGVEVRMPFLYDDVVHRASRFTATELMQRRGKGPLKDLLLKYDGKRFINRTKMGFGLPMRELLRQEEWQRLWSFLERDNQVFAFVPKINIKTMLHQHLQKKSDNSMQLWAILVLENWLSRN